MKLGYGNFARILISAAFQTRKKHGTIDAVRIVMHRIFSFIYYRTFSRNKTFFFLGNQYKHHFSLFNRTWMNERCIEIPIILDILNKNKSRSILEIGNVLQNYVHISHDVLDKYEIANGVINEDIVDFKPDKKYDLIISISTLEHIGWDESPKHPPKILDAIITLKNNVLSKDGMIVATVPIGYNSYLDKLLDEKTTGFTEQLYLLRTSMNDWREAKWEEVCDCKYESPFPAANALAILLYR